MYIYITSTRRSIYTYTKIAYLPPSPSLSTVLSDRREGFLVLAAFVILISSGIRILMELFQVFQLRVLNYFLDWVNWIELLLFTFSILFVFVFFTDCLCPRYVQCYLSIYMYKHTSYTVCVCMCTCKLTS